MRRLCLELPETTQPVAIQASFLDCRQDSATWFGFVAARPASAALPGAPPSTDATAAQADVLAPSGTRRLDASIPATYGNHMRRDAKTTVYLDADIYRRLKALAVARECPAAALVREAVAQYVLCQAPAVAPSSIGMGQSRRSDLGERAEELLGGMGRGG